MTKYCTVLVGIMMTACGASLPSSVDFAQSVDDEQVLQLRRANPRSTGAANRNERNRDPGGQDAEGLTGEYFENMNLKGKPAAIRIDPRVYFYWAKQPHPDVREDRFSVRWSGKIKIPADGQYRFICSKIGGFRLWVDGQLLTDDWVDESAITRQSIAKIHLTRGKKDIRIELFDKTDVAQIALNWDGPGVPIQVIPASVLSPAGGGRGE